MSNNANIDLGIVIQKLTKQISELVLQNTLLQTQIEMLLQKPQQHVTSNIQPTPKQDNKPTIQSELNQT